MSLDGAALYSVTVPVFRHYLDRIDALAAAGGETALAWRLSPDGFDGGAHFGIAQGFMLRTVFPLLDRTIPVLSEPTDSADALARRSDEVRAALAPLTPRDFEVAPGRTVTHTAGFARLAQGATDYVTLFALPNTCFHLTMGYAALRAAGVAVGKADFDGLHAYPTGFSFDDTTG